MKKSFILYKDNRDLFDELSNEEAGQLIKALFAYCDGENPELTGVTRMAFISIRTALKRDLEKWKQTVEKRREAGSIGGKKKAENLAIASKCYKKLANGSKCKQNLANLADNVSVNVSDSVIEEQKKDTNVSKKNIDYSVLKLSDDQLMDLKTIRKSKKGVETQRAINILANEFNKAREAGYSDDQIIDLICERKWTGFKFDWMQNALGTIKEGTKGFRRLSDEELFEQCVENQLKIGGISREAAEESARNTVILRSM